MRAKLSTNTYTLWFETSMAAQKQLIKRPSTTIRSSSSAATAYIDSWKEYHPSVNGIQKVYRKRFCRRLYIRELKSNLGKFNPIRSTRDRIWASKFISNWLSAPALWELSRIHGVYSSDINIAHVFFFSQDSINQTPRFCCLIETALA
jgi:hypothetical protein